MVEQDEQAHRPPWWERFAVWATRPVRVLWHSREPLDAYALVQVGGAFGDALIAVALADSVFFSIPVGQAKLKVALYLVLTMAPLAVAAPALVPLLDRSGLLRTIAFAAAGARGVVALYAASRLGSLLLFPLAFLLLVLSKVNGITKNGLTMGYAPTGEGLVGANARLSRITVIGGLLAVGPGVALLKLAGAEVVVNLAAAAYFITMVLTLRLPRPKVRRVQGDVSKLGAIPRLTVASVGTVALKAASGFLLFLLAFALRTGDQPAYWFGVLALSAAAGGFLGDLAAPRLSRFFREEAAVFTSLLAAGVVAMFAAAAFRLAVLAVFAGFAGLATEFGRLSFQSLMQRFAPEGAHGRVFVRYDMAFQLAWVAGALLPAILPISFRVGVWVMALFYLTLGVVYLTRPVLFRRLFERSGPG